MAKPALQHAHVPLLCQIKIISSCKRLIQAMPDGPHSQIAAVFYHILDAAVTPSGMAMSLQSLVPNGNHRHSA
jgi:hypothetical protein